MKIDAILAGAVRKDEFRAEVAGLVAIQSPRDHPLADRVEESIQRADCQVAPGSGRVEPNPRPAGSRRAAGAAVNLAGDALQQRPRRLSNFCPL
jgi:hypothetical protein